MSVKRGLLEIEDYLLHFYFHSTPMEFRKSTFPADFTEYCQFPKNFSKTHNALGYLCEINTGFEAMKLKILVRLNPSLGTTKLSAIPCGMHFIVRQALGGGENATVNELLRVTDLTLGNVNVNLLVPEHALHLLDVLKCVNKGRSVCKP